MARRNNNNRTQFRGQIASETPAKVEETTTDKFEEESEDPVVYNTAGEAIGIRGTTGMPGLTGEESPEALPGVPGPGGPRGEPRPAGYNYDGSVATIDNDHRSVEDREADEAATKEFPNGRVGPLGAPGIRGDTGPQGERLIDEREGEDDPTLDQDHEEDESEVIDLPEVGEEVLIATEESVEDEQAAFVQLSGDASLSQDEIEASLGARLEDVATRIEEPPAPAFPYTEVATWTTEELALYISKPETMDIYHSKLLQAITEHRRRETTLNEAWSTDECTAFFKQNVEPPKAKSGCYLNDVTRKVRRESSWTTQELEAWAQGDIKPEGLVTQNGLASELHQRFRMPINSVEPELVLAHYNYHYGPGKGTVQRVGQIPVAKAEQPAAEEVKAIEQKIKYAGLTEMNQTYIESALQRYVDAVRPNRQINPEKVGFPAQRELDTVLHAILKEVDPAGVKSGLDILVKVIVEERIANHRGVFSDTNAFRFAEGITAVGRAQEIHRRLLTLFFAFIDGDEGILAQTDVPELVKYLPSRQQNLLLNYFNRA